MDDGISWSNDVRLTFDDNQSLYPSIAAYGNNIHILWVKDETDYVKLPDILKKIEEGEALILQF